LPAHLAAGNPDGAADPPPISLNEPHPPFYDILRDVVHRAAARGRRGAQPGQRVGHGLIHLRGNHPGRLPGQGHLIHREPAEPLYQAIGTVGVVLHADRS